MLAQTKVLDRLTAVYWYTRSNDSNDPLESQNSDIIVC